MNQKILKIVLNNKDQFIPLIFTKKQMDTLKRYSKKEKLKNSEKKSLYTSIKKKMDALNLFYLGQKGTEYWIKGSDKIISSRLAKARKILDEYSKKNSRVFISGSFLFSKEYNDIDIFILGKRGYKEEVHSNKHLIFLSEKKLSDPIFQSASLISVSNFNISKVMRKKKPTLSQAMATYHEAIIEHMKGEKKPESIRQLIFDYHLFCRKEILDGRSLNRLSAKVTLKDIDSFIKDLCSSLFSKNYLYVEIHDYIKTLKDSIKNISPNYHLKHYKDNYEELIYAKQKDKARAA